MPDPKILKFVKLRSQHQPSGFTRHFVRGELVGKPVELRIVQYEGQRGEGYYLFYCNETGHEITDTYHDTIERAIRQAELEFGVRWDEWNSGPDGA